MSATYGSVDVGMMFYLAKDVLAGRHLNLHLKVGQRTMATLISPDWRDSGGWVNLDRSTEVVPFMTMPIPQFNALVARIAPAS